MPNTQSNIPRRWQEIAKTQHRQAFTSALIELGRIDEGIDYSYEQSMRAFADGPDRPGADLRDLDIQAKLRIRLRARKYEIIASLLAGTVKG